MVLLPATGAGLRLVGFLRWNSLLSKAVPRGTPLRPVSPELVAESSEVARMVAAASRNGVFHGKCLERSIVLWFLLLRKRVPAELRIGVRHTANGLEAHAWVEVQGTVVNDTEDVVHDYVPFSKDIASLGIEQR
jgi:Transglutaminase-like superfamily